jgi:S1-C subfamily serine protease
LLAGTLRAQSDDRPLVTTARKTLQTYGKSVILLAAVLKMEAKGMEGLEHEQKTQCTAVIIDPSGLAVTALTNLNPAGVLPKIRVGRGGSSQTLELDFQVQEVKYKLADGTEVPARVVLKDEDLDLAFLAPLKPLDEATRAKIAVLPLGDAASQVESLDDVILIDRTTDDFNYIPTLDLGRISAVVSNPRTCYLLNGGAMGMPVFDGQGKVMGIVCQCIKPDKEEGGLMARIAAMTSSGANSHLVLPAADVTKLVPQAKEEMKKAADAEKKSGAAKKKTGEKKKSGETKKK